MKKNKVGRPDGFEKINFIKLKNLVLAGLTDIEIGEGMGVTGTTIRNWQKNRPEFFATIKDWKKKADERVQRSLYERACGYTVEEEELFFHKGQIYRANKLKHYAPDPVSCIFWLKNRQPDQWRDRVEHTGKDGGAMIDFSKMAELILTSEKERGLS